MLVVGLHGWILPPGAILICDIFVYSEFLIHPILLLGASGKMRREVIRGVKTSVTVRWNLFHLDHIWSWHFIAGGLLDEIKRKIFLWPYCMKTVLHLAAYFKP